MESQLVQYKDLTTISKLKVITKIGIPLLITNIRILLVVYFYDKRYYGIVSLGKFFNLKFI